MAEVPELTLELVCPLLTVEKIVALPIDNDQKGYDGVGLIFILSTENCLYNIGPVVCPKMQIFEGTRESALGKVPIFEIRKMLSEVCGVQAPAISPLSN